MKDDFSVTVDAAAFLARFDGTPPDEGRRNLSELVEPCSCCTGQRGCPECGGVGWVA